MTESRYRLVWTVSEHLGDNSHWNGYPLTRTHSAWHYDCRIEQWSNSENDWYEPDDPAKALSEGFCVDPVDPRHPDPEDDAPYTETEDRLLARAGLTRDRIEEICTPDW